MNPHDIAFAGGFYELLLGFEPGDDTVPDIPEPPSQSDSFAGRPACQEQFKALWPQMVAAQSTDVAYRRLYYYLHKLVDQAIGRILDALDASGMADDTIVVFTSDHGDLLGAHGGLQQKWANAFDEATRVPMLVRGPGVEPVPGGITAPTSHVDLIPTLLGLAGIDLERATEGVRQRHTEAQPLPGRDLSGVITGREAAATLDAPIYFMTEDAITRGLTQRNVLSGDPFESLEAAACIESVVAELPTGADGAGELWKLNHYYERLDDWYADHGVAPDPFAAPAAEPSWELHNLTRDPEERTNLAGQAGDEQSRLQTLLEAQREESVHLGRLLAEPLAEQLKALTGSRYQGVSVSTELETEGVIAAGAPRAWAQLSVGTREQLATLCRLALARQVGSLVVLDDQLVQSDRQRMAWFSTLLREVGQTIQVVVFTCRERDYVDADAAGGDALRAVDLTAHVTRAG